MNITRLEKLYGKGFLMDYMGSRAITFGMKLKDQPYDKIYYRTNEDLVDTYLDVDFYDKDVLSVLASSDQVFTARLLDAKKVDAFDKNVLTKYYFYLRLWTIKYTDRLFPNIYDRNFIKELLIFVHPETIEERRAYDFFKEHLHDKTDFSQMFFIDEVQPIGKRLYEKPQELEDCLSPDLDFYEIDLFEKKEHPKSYDIVIISNILDWARHDKDKLENAAFNLNKYTRHGGYILGSNLIERSKEEKEEEQGIMKEYFDLEEERRKSYVYRKK